jgi:hypothetical protein
VLDQVLSFAEGAGPTLYFQRPWGEVIAWPLKAILNIFPNQL